MTRAEVVKREREQDILDQLALGQIDKRQAGKLLTELHQDFYEAMCVIRLCEEAEKRS